MDRRIDLDALDDVDPFEIDAQAAHLFKHDALGIDDIYEVWRPIRSSIPPSHQPTGSWSPRSPARSSSSRSRRQIPGTPTRCRPIGCYIAAKHLADRYREDR